MKFKKWIAANGGPKGVAPLLNVTPHAIRVWLRGEGAPRLVTLRDIVKISRGRLTYDDIINDIKGKRKV